MSYTLGIPAAQNNPSNDQPLMQGNFTAINNWTIVDHVGFNQSASGQHLQVTFNSENPPVAAPTDPTSILFTNAGTASTVATLFFQNANSIFPISTIKAFGSYPGSSSIVGPLTAKNQYNVAAVNRNSKGMYTVTLNSGVVPDTNYGILVGSAGPLSGGGIISFNYTIASSTSFNLTFGLANISTADPSSFTFAVIEI